MTFFHIYAENVQSDRDYSQHLDTLPDIQNLTQNIQLIKAS